MKTTEVPFDSVQFMYHPWSTIARELLVHNQSPVYHGHLQFEENHHCIDLERWTMDIVFSLLLTVFFRLGILNQVCVS